MKSKLFRTFNWLIVNGAVWCILYAALVHANEIAWNIFIFALVLNTVLWMFVFLATFSDSWTPMKPTFLPPIVPFISDMAQVFFLAAFGHFAFAAILVFQTLLEHAVQKHDVRSKGAQV
jgi:hypothetical protein